VITRSAPAAADQAPRIANLLVIAETEIVPVAGGKPLPNSASGRRPEQDLAEAVTRLVGSHGFALRPQCAPEASKNRNDWALALLRAVERQDYRNVQQCLTYRAKGLPRNSPLPIELDADARNRLERLVGELIKIQAGATRRCPCRARPFGGEGPARGEGAAAGEVVPERTGLILPLP
jgi:hypothetical protein